MPNGFSYRHSADGSICNVKGVWLVFINFLLISCFIEIHVFNANSVDLDQTPQSPLIGH